MNDRDHEARHPLMEQAAEGRRPRRTRRRFRHAGAADPAGAIAAILSPKGYSPT